MYFILNNMDDNVEDKLDDNWIIDFENKDKLYQDFYKDDLYYINLKFFYINKFSEIEKIKNENFLMSSPNRISREEMIGILKHNAKDNNILYSLLSILKYTIHLEPEDITHFLFNSEDFNFLNVNKNIDAITFEKTINMFQDLNDLIFIFYEKPKEERKSNFTKKNLIASLSRKKKTIRKTT
jgi:hypothetical protein